MLDVRKVRQLIMWPSRAVSAHVVSQSSECVFLSEPVVFDQFWANSMVHVYLILSACET